MESDTFAPFSMPEPITGWTLPKITTPDASELVAAKEVLDCISEAIRAYKVGLPSQSIGIDHLDRVNAEVVAQVLGDGEVSIKLDAQGIRIQESVMPGIWRVDSGDRQWIEVADMPQIIRATINSMQQTEPVIPATLPDGTMNILPVLAEIRAAALEWTPGKETVEINLSLLPMSPVDLQVLSAALGNGPVEILSRGYGNCRVQSLGVRHVWRTSYFNTDENMILDCLVVGDVPAAALAAQEDIDDGLDRLARIMEAYF